VHGVVCVGEAEQQAVEDLLPAQLTHFSVTREQRQCLQTKRGANDVSVYNTSVEDPNLVVPALFLRIRIRIHINKIKDRLYFLLKKFQTTVQNI
jgi:hypothetical protein